MQSPTQLSTNSDDNKLEYEEIQSPITPQLRIKKNLNSQVQTKNQHLNCMEDDCLYHLGHRSIGLNKENAVDYSNDKYVCILSTT